jgi:murein DD-endopeptidase MepM/ murein hydrolase activator NlpD
MVLTVMLPTTAGATAEAPQEALATSSISAATEARLTFERAGLTSKFDPDTKLKQVMVASGGKAQAIGSEGTLSQPMDELIKTSPFGYRVSPITGYAGELHTGQDYGAPCGTPVAAAAGGTVVEAGFQVGGGGNRIVVDHGNGLETTYNHLSTIDTTVGAAVARGEVLGESGTTGASTGCHLHFEVMVNGKLVDPTGWL